MTNRERFLVENVGFHFDDLTLMRQLELETLMREMNLSRDWIMLALSRKSLEEWEAWGFALFHKKEFCDEVNKLLSAINRMDEQHFQKENNKRKGPQLWVSEETFMRAWNGVKAQGKIYTEAEAAALKLDLFWTYNRDILTPEGYTALDEMAKQPMLSQEDWLSFALGVKCVRYVKPDAYN